MIEHEVLLYPDIEFAPKTEEQEILQNVRTICTTPKYSVPMDREFGISAVMVDEAMNRAGAKYKSEIIQAVRKYEPRARVSRVEFFRDAEGKEFHPRVWIKIVT